MIVYRGEYTDVEANPVTNANEQVVKRLDILDQASNPFNVVMTQVTASGSTTFTFTFDPLPPGAIKTRIIWTDDGGISWQFEDRGTTSPQSILLSAAGDYAFRFAIYLADGSIEVWFSDETITPIEFTDDPVRDIVIDNDEDKFTPIRARQLEIKIFSSNDISINTFAQGADDRYRVNWYINGVLNFTGFLSISDLSQEFMPNPNVINLVAVDRLGLLNDIPLKDFDGETPMNEQTLLDFLLWALSKTGLRLNLKTIFNIREVTASSMDADSDGEGHFFKYLFIDAKTFEEEIGQCENCYDVITKILGQCGCLFQYLGKWVIIRIDEIDHNLAVQTSYTWDWTGTFIEKLEEANERNIGVGQEYSFMNDDALVSIAGLVRESRLNYKYDTPKEIPCNPDFERGDVVDDSIPTEKTYELDCWGKFRENFPTSGLIPATVNIYTHRKFINDYETERYVVIPFAAISSNLILSSNIIVQKSDKISVTMSRRLSSDVASSGFYRDNGMQVRLLGTDGTFWVLQGETSVGDTLQWVQSNSTFTTNNKYLWFEGDVSRDMTEPESLYGDTESPPVPIGGIIQLLAHQSHQASWNRDTYILSIGFELLAFINGSYRKFTGQQTIVAQNVRNKNIREEDVFISDSPHPQYKGALKIFNGTSYVLAGLFYDAAKEPAGSPAAPKKFAEIQAFDVWNQFNRTMVRFDGQVDHSNPAPGMINKFFITDSNENSNNRIFLLLHYEYDSYLCEWNSFLSEVSNSDVPKTYDGFTLKFLTK